MKKLLSYLTISIVFLVNFQSFAQYRNYGSRPGMNTNTPSNNRTKKEPIDQVEAMTQSMTAKLNLDRFQSAVVKNVIEEYIATVNRTAMENIPDEAKAEKDKIAQNLVEAKFDNILNDKQKIIFEESKTQSSSKKKNSKKRKSAVDSEE